MDEEMLLRWVDSITKASGVQTDKVMTLIGKVHDLEHRLLKLEGECKDIGKFNTLTKEGDQL